MITKSHADKPVFKTAIVFITSRKITHSLESLPQVKTNKEREHKTHIHIGKRVKDKRVMNGVLLFF